MQELGGLFVRQKSDDKVFRSFFKDHMVQSFAIPRSWESDPITKKDLIYDILSFGYTCVQNKNMNRYKYFSWFMPPTYELIDKIQIDQSSGTQTLEALLLTKPSVLFELGITKANILKEIVAACMQSLKKGSDVDLLLRDGTNATGKLFPNTFD